MIKRIIENSLALRDSNRNYGGKISRWNSPALIKSLQKKKVPV